MNRIKWIGWGMLLMMGLCQCANEKAFGKQKEEPKIQMSILRDSTPSNIKTSSCYVASFSTESLQQEYQLRRNEYLADGGVMLHEEFASHHYAIKVKKNDTIHYQGSLFKGDQKGMITMDHKEESDSLWHQLMRALGEKIGMSEAEMASDGM